MCFTMRLLKSKLNTICFNRLLRYGFADKGDRNNLSTQSQIRPAYKLLIIHPQRFSFDIEQRLIHF